MRHRFRRGADIDKQRRAIGDLLRHFAGDALFFFGLGGFTIVPRRVNRTGRQRRAAMMAQDQVLLCQLVEVAANSLRADGEVLHQFLGTDITLLFNQFDNTVVTLCLFHL
ncbi:hypothetical protein DP20_3669 [Shigella flexneri]|nr:hypothetical protein DP20_3669 [Shigella flexneri]SRL33993.1 Uncharacterised protein [Shigella flexneri]SRM99802.1 Uncharacterised protein [Shigella flexneri]